MTPASTPAARILELLNEPQQVAVQALGGPVLVLAGPGSGKTKVLTHRIAYLISALGIDPHAILAVTFTNKAAREMRERLTALIGDELTRRLTVGTFHSVNVRLLRRDIEKLGWNKTIVEFARDDAQTYDALARLGERASVLVDFIEGDGDRRRAAVAYRASEAMEQALAGLQRDDVALSDDPKQWLPAGIRDEAVRRGIITYRSDFTVYDDDDQMRLTRQVLKELNLDEKQYSPRAIHSAISRAKNELVGPVEFAALGRSYWDEIVARCYESYQKRLQAANALDFDDLLVQTVRLLNQKPFVLETLQKRYVHSLIDEYQDVNTAQYEFAKLISGHYRNLFAVGDEDQSVYAFRGANMRYVLQFEEDFPDARLILLEQNYRSTQAILDVASSLINAGDRRRRVKKLWTQNDRGVLVHLREAYNEEEEARLVCDEIDRLRNSEGLELRDCAVLYRTNAQSRALEEAFLTRGLRYRLVGGVRFYERKEIKDILAYLRVIGNPFDSVSLERIIEATPGIGRQTIAGLLQWADELEIPAYSALQLMDSEENEIAPPFSNRARTSLLTFLHMMDELIAARDEHNLIELLDLTLERTRFHDALQREHGDEEGETRWENVLELRTVAAQYGNFPREAQLPTFLEEVALVAATDDLIAEQDAVTLITMHQAKGLEYPAVFIVGLEEGLMPHARSLEDAEQLEEERRLMYVAATRAEQRLYLYYAFKRRLYGRENMAVPSRFLADIPHEYMKRREQRDREDRSFTQSSLFTGRSQVGGWPSSSGTGRRGTTSSWGQSARKNTTPIKPAASARFTPGTKVRHAQFGEGIVVSSAVKGDDEEVTVAFVGQGVKKLLASFANLQPVDA